MAQLTASEFGEAVAALAEHHGVERLRERLARMNAFTSRRGLNSAVAIADRLYLLTGGLRRAVPATYAFSSLWNEMVGGHLGEDGEKKLETIAEQVNGCLDEQEAIVAGKEPALDEALAGYRDALAAVTGPRVAELDMILKAVPAVAERLRQPATPQTDSAEG
jgi:ABC-type transporter Mla subunit MlaD